MAEKLISTIGEFLKYIIVDVNIQEDKLLIFSAKAERKIKSIIGKAQYSAFVSSTEEDEAKELLTSSVAQLSLLYAMPSLKLRITDAGIFTTTTTNTRAPEWWEIRDLHNSLKNTAFSSIDEALEIMEENPDKYQPFIDSDNFTEFKELIVSKTSIFNKYYNINNSRLTYLGLTTFIREAIDEYLFPCLQDCLFSIPPTEKGKTLLELLQKALTSLSVVKAVESGNFLLQNETLIVKWEQMPWEKSEKLSDTLLEKLKNSRLSAGLNYLSLAKKFIKNNLLEFPCMTNVINKKQDSKIFVRKSGIYLK